MSTESIVLWICQREADCPLVYAIPVALFGKELPKLEAFVTAVTQPPRDDDDDSTEHPSDGSEGEDEEGGDERKNDRPAPRKRVRFDPAARVPRNHDDAALCMIEHAAAKAFRNYIDATEFMIGRLAQLGVPVRTGAWQNVWEQPLKVVLSIYFEI